LVFVIFSAIRALEALNFAPLNGKNIRLMFSNRDPSMRKSGRANVFVKNLEPSIDSKSLHDMFSSFGTILSCKVATDASTGQSKGYGFVQYESEKSAQEAINMLNGMLADGRKIFVGLHMRRQNREVKFTNLYVKNLPAEFTDDDLRQEFAPFGEITSAVIMRHSDGASKCFGFVNFEKPEYATEALQKLNGKSIDDKVLYVGKAQKKAERQAELKAKFQQGIEGKVEKPQGINLYLKNIDDSINDEKLKQLFEEFGEITSCKVILSVLVFFFIEGTKEPHVSRQCTSKDVLFQLMCFDISLGYG
jgi:polyadenylate-binding protein